MLDTFPQGDAYAIHDTPVVPLGECVRDSITGFLWSYQKASHDLEEGNALGPYLNILVSADLPAAVAAGTTIFDQLIQSRSQHDYRSGSSQDFAAQGACVSQR